MQLVVSGNRILAHGEDCFIPMGGTVVCTKTGRVFQNATVVTDCENCPTDIDSVGYEYHAGAFVPCAPYGTDSGDGKIMVACDDCATPRKSEWRLSDVLSEETAAQFGLGPTATPDNAFKWLAEWVQAYFVRYETGSYTGTGKHGEGNPNSLTLSAKPKILIIGTKDSGTTNNAQIIPLYHLDATYAPVRGTDEGWLSAKVDGNTVYWYSGAEGWQRSVAGVEYYYMALT